MVEAISRYDAGFELSEIIIDPMGSNNPVNQVLAPNQKITMDLSLTIPGSMPISHPYWLNGQGTLGMYHVEDERNIAKPENDPVFSARMLIRWEDQFLEYEVPVSFKRNDPVDGEVYRPVVISPPIMVNLDSKVLVFADENPKSVEVKLISGTEKVSGKLKFDVPDGWVIEPESIDVEFTRKNEEIIHIVSIKAPSEASQEMLSAYIEFEDGTTSGRGRTIIEYDHIPVQTLFPKAEIQLVKVDLNILGKQIGYIEGAGDAIPENLRQIGYSVEILDKDDVIGDNLSKYDAIILGVRAFNTVDWLSFRNKDLFQYVENGGTVIVQYNTSFRLVTDEIAPYPISLSRDRVTEESAEVRILTPDHPVMNFPNQINEKDFKGWKQERGLYFPDEWDAAFTPILSSNDPDETPKDGGLLVSKYGKGYYIYSGYSWFRELPAGVPGAYRIFTNMISIGQLDELNK
jgi:hypothetical protein